MTKPRFVHVGDDTYLNIDYIVGFKGWQPDEEDDVPVTNVFDVTGTGFWKLNDVVASELCDYLNSLDE